MACSPSKILDFTVTNYPKHLSKVKKCQTTYLDASYMLLENSAPIWIINCIIFPKNKIHIRNAQASNPKRRKRRFLSNDQSNILDINERHTPSIVTSETIPHLRGWSMYNSNDQFDRCFRRLCIQLQHLCLDYIPTDHKNFDDHKTECHVFLIFTFDPIS